MGHAYSLYAQVLSAFGYGAMGISSILVTVTSLHGLSLVLFLSDYCIYGSLPLYGLWTSVRLMEIMIS